MNIRKLKDVLRKTVISREHVIDNGFDTIVLDHPNLSFVIKVPINREMYPKVRKGYSEACTSLGV